MCTTSSKKVTWYKKLLPKGDQLEQLYLFLALLWCKYMWSYIRCIENSGVFSLPCSSYRRFCVTSVNEHMWFLCWMTPIVAIILSWPLYNCHQIYALQLHNKASLFFFCDFLYISSTWFTYCGIGSCVYCVNILGVDCVNYGVCQIVNQSVFCEVIMIVLEQSCFTLRLHKVYLRPL